jgi:para-nitrobenzyl esterase
MITNKRFLNFVSGAGLMSRRGLMSGAGLLLGAELLLGAGLVLALCGFSDAVGTVKVEGGYISGAIDASGEIHIFKGIPFAAPPVGPLRWRAPQPVAAWNGVRACVQFGPSPMQNKPVPFMMWSEEYLIREKPIGEDCLYLNVWTGAKTAKEKRPVLVWIYGGGFVSGGANVPIYDGDAMAKKGVLFVSFNYRVGIFGFFAHPDLTRESGHQASGNYGLMDQIAALTWVQKNIAAFGGDPDNVTIAGQSAGSMSVSCLMASPLAAGLFQKAIGESGASFINAGTSLSDAEVNGQKQMERVNAGSIEALRAMPAEELLKKITPGLRMPIIDGWVLPERVADLFKEGKENKVRLLTGWNEDEGLLFSPVKKAQEFRQGATKYGGDAATFLRFFPAGDDSEAAVSQLKLSGDMIIGVQNYDWANIVSAQGLTVYLYRFVRKPPTVSGAPLYGAFHTAEVPYAYDNLRFVKRPWEPLDYNLADAMSSYWVNFAKAGDPNGIGLPSWSPYSQGDGKTMIFGNQPTAGLLPDKEELDFVMKKMMEN